MIQKPETVFDREAEWAALTRFVRSPLGSPGVGGRLGVVSGRRRQGKTFLLDALTRAVGGFHFVAADDTEAEALRRFGEALGQHTGGGRYHFRNWDEAIDRLYGIVGDGLIVIDEFPYLSKASPVLPSLLQRALDPRGAAHRSRAKLLLCGSAMSVMGSLLAGQAPLRGRASLELIVKPMDYLTAAKLWGCDEPKLAVLLHAIVGGTPAYRYEFVGSDAPDSLADFDDWVVRTALDHSIPLFREARYLLAEEAEIRDPALYHAVLGAIASGNGTRGGIANYIGKQATHINHPLNVLEDCALITKEEDAFRTGRARYRIAEPLITFYEAIMRKTWTLLEIGRARQAWEVSKASFDSQVVGPHYKALCRQYTLRSGLELFGDIPGRVAAGTVSDPANRTQIEVDVAVLAAATTGAGQRVLSLGECKWGKIMNLRHLERLERARNLLAVKGMDMTSTTLVCYSGVGFDAELRRRAAEDSRVMLVGLEQLYA